VVKTLGFDPRFEGSNPSTPAIVVVWENGYPLDCKSRSYEFESRDYFHTEGWQSGRSHFLAKEASPSQGTIGSNPIPSAIYFLNIVAYPIKLLSPVKNISG
jgi:hypothetical protein